VKILPVLLELQVKDKRMLKLSKKQTLSHDRILHLESSRYRITTRVGWAIPIIWVTRITWCKSPLDYELNLSYPNN